MAAAETLRLPAPGEAHDMNARAAKTGSMDPLGAGLILNVVKQKGILWTACMALIGASGYSLYWGIEGAGWLGVNIAKPMADAWIDSQKVLSTEVSKLNINSEKATAEIARLNVNSEREVEETSKLTAAVERGTASSEANNRALNGLAEEIRRTRAANNQHGENVAHEGG